MKVHVVQKDTNNGDLKPFLQSAGEAGADLVCFGELATSGALYEPREIDTLEDTLAQFEPYDFRIMTGLPLAMPAVRSDNDKLHNIYMYYHRGEYQFYHKINLFPGMNETVVYQAGSEPGIFQTDFGEVGAAICYDLRFDKIFADFKQLGVEKIFMPAAWPAVRIHDWKRLLRERAVESSATVIGINCVGDDGTNLFGGSSMVVAPDGHILAEADETSETVLEVIL